MILNKKVYLTGHNGMVGQFTLLELIKRGYSNILTMSSKDLDLRDQKAVDTYFNINRPEIVIHIAAKVGGIASNIQFPADYIYDNIMIESNVFSACVKYKIEKVLFLGSSCVYPKDCDQPMKEEYLFTGLLEPTNEFYSIAKIAGLKLLEAYKMQYNLQSISLIPSNIYGPNDSFDLNQAHVLSSLVKRFSDAKRNKLKNITLWGTGIAKREFTFVSDISSSILFFLDKDIKENFINIGTGSDISIKELADLIKDKINYEGEILWDTDRPDGMLQKCLDVSKMKKYGFFPKVSLDQGVDNVINSYNIKFPNI
jgi:GDP-L-fucose synthase